MTDTRVDLAAASWRKSSFSDGGGGDCVEIADNIPHTVPVRDSKNPAGPALLIPAPPGRPSSRWSSTGDPTGARSRAPRSRASPKEKEPVRTHPTNPRSQSNG